MDDRFRLSASEAEHLAREFGTPLYVLDEGTFRGRIRAYRSAFQEAEIHYASKANSTLALLKIAYEEGCRIDVASEGELRAALLAGVPPYHLTLHGNNKPLALLRWGIELGVGEIVVDALEEVDRLLSLPAGTSKLVLRVNPGVKADTHDKIAVGHRASKFGFPPEALKTAVQRLLEAQRAPHGLHFHLGSQILDLAPYREGVSRIVALAKELEIELDWTPQLFNLGGGLGVRYTDQNPPTVEALAQTLSEGLIAWGKPYQLGQEPGRSLIGEAGLTLLSVGVVKEVGETLFVAVDGGLFENPRPALYGAKYEVELIGEPGSPTSGTVVGAHCENDVLYEDIRFKRAPKADDLVQVLSTGAYSSAMASNYNRFPRPASVLKRTNGKFELVQRRETYEDMFAREIL